MDMRYMKALAFACAVYLGPFVADAMAQCAASGVAYRPPARDTTAPHVPPAIIGAWDAPIWKRISVGTFPNSLTLRNALDSAGCSQGDLAEEALARPSFQLSVARADLDLVSLSASDLGLRGETARLGAIYERALMLGFWLAPAEVGPQLRLQYLDQPVGEVLHVGMKPVRTWNGERVIFAVANGGAGLLLLGQDVAVDEISTRTRFLFVRPADVAARGCPGCTAAIGDQIAE